MKKILLIQFFLIELAAAGQDSSQHNTGLIYKKWPGWKMDGKRLSQAKLKTEIYKTPAAIPFYKRANTNLITA